MVIHILDLKISERTRNALMRSGISTLDELIAKKEMDFSQIRNVGKDTEQEIYSIIANADEITKAFSERKARIEAVAPQYKDMLVDDLNLGTRLRNALRNARVHTVAQLIRMSEMDIHNLRGIGILSISELHSTVNKLIGLENEDDAQPHQPMEGVERSDERREHIEMRINECGDTAIEATGLSNRAVNSLRRSGRYTIADLLRLSASDLLSLPGSGVKTSDEISAFIDGILREGSSFMKVAQQQAMLVEQDSELESDSEQFVQKGFDFVVIDTLIKDFSFKPAQMTEWFGLSRQSIYNALEKRNRKRTDCWTGKPLNADEEKILHLLIDKRKFEYNDDTLTCCCMNNMQDNFVCLFIYENEIKCFFLADLPTELQELVTSNNYHRFTERELSGESAGRIVEIIKKPHFLPDQPERFRANAQLRGISPNDYAVFLYGCPLCNAKNITDEQITAFLEDNLVDGKVYISSDPKNQWIKSIASRNGYSIKDFIELYGYESALAGSELTTDAARDRHIEALKKCIVHDNVVYFPTDSNVYRVLSTYCYGKSMGINDYIRSLGFVRTTVRPDTKIDTTEKDMQVRSTLPDVKFEEKVFAQYPLIGSRILKEETLDKLNQNTRKYIDLVLRQPLTHLTPIAEMQVTLALINNAKNWKNEENPNFWNYITLQFGYRDASGAVLRLLQSSLENSLKRNDRLFLEDANGRAFKSTAVVHALSTKKSWMALFDFLFDFYKNNLDWKLIPGDPLLELMIRALQKKLAGDTDEDSELNISSHVYSFQEGIRKLILFRPIFTRQLFEKLIGKIDALINAEEMPVKTYEEQLCEEWFKEKIISIANTKKTERQKTDSQREIAIDYSRIRAKYILKKEDTVQLVLPDIRLKREDIQRASLIIYYQNSVVHQQNLSWYGNELGKTLNGISVTLPELNGDLESIELHIQIICDTETIYDSEETLNRQFVMFDSGNEVNVAQIHRSNYTIVLPESSVFEVENAEITEIDSFRTHGLKAYFLELQDGYVLTVNGKLLAFDSENGTDVRVIPPSESASLPRVTTADDECYLAFRGSVCTIILGNADYKQQFVIMKNGKRLEFSDLEVEGSGLAFTCPLSGDKDFCRLQVINLGDERLVFDRSFMLVSSAECAFDREFYFSNSDYKDALYFAEIDDYYEEAVFAAEDSEVRIPFRNGELHVDIPKVQIQETTGEWLNGTVPAWYVGDIPQNSLLRVNVPSGTSARFFLDGKDIMYDGQGLVTLGNVIQSFAGSDSLRDALVEVKISGKKQEQRYVLTRVCFQECFLKQPEFWFSEGRLFWNQGGSFVGKSDRIFTLTLCGENDALFEFALGTDVDSIELPEDMPIGNYQFEISILAGSLFKKVRKTIANGDCVIGDQNLLRFNGRRIVIDAITDEFKEEAGRIAITTCYIDQLEFVGIEDTSEGLCPVYRGVLYAKSNYGDRYEFSYDHHTNAKGITKMMVNPVRIVYIGDSALCITDSEGDGLYYYNYYDKFTGTIVYALTDREYTKVNKHKYSTADLYSYRTERI